MTATPSDGGWLVIFDCDGVLVDSEPIALSVLQEMLAEEGIQMTPEVVSERFLGRSFGTVIGLVRADYGIELDAAFAAKMRGRLFERFERELKPIKGITKTLDRLAAEGTAFCVASSSQPARIEKSLTVTGLLNRFSGHIFSAAMVERGKPAPDLFLHAASSLGFAPGRCMVVEDSPSGVEAALAAHMHVFAFTGGSHTQNPVYRAAMSALAPDARFDAMENLLHLVDRVRRAEDSFHA